MNFRRLSVGATSFVAVGLATLAVAWACTSAPADMKLENTAAPDAGKNYTTCAPSSYPNSCGRSVKVTGSSFVNNDGVAIPSVDLYWLDEPFFAAGAGTQGVGERVAGQVCSTKGVRIATGVSISGAGAFTATVTVPPTASTYQDGTSRPLNAYYGANAVCAVWLHTPATGSPHLSGLGNQYTIYPA